MSAIGQRIQQRRKELGMTQEELAELLTTNQFQVSRYETGKNSPTAEVIKTLADVLEVSADWLLGRGGEDLSDDERYLLDTYRSKDNDGKHRMLEVARVI